MKKFKAFVFDDDAVIAEKIKKLGDQYFPELDFFVFNTGDDSLEDLDNRPDIIIIDIHLQFVQADAMNGLLVLKRIMYKHPGTHVIYITPDESYTPETILGLGSYDYIVRNENTTEKLRILLKNIIRELQLKRRLNNWKKISLFLFLTTVISILFIMIKFLLL